MNQWIAKASLLLACLCSPFALAPLQASSDAAHDDAEGEVAMPVVGDADAGKAASAACAGCHGAEGMAIMPEYPNLAGQHASYIAKQLTEFRDGLRENAIMSPQAANLGDEDILNIAAYYAAMPKMQSVADEEGRLALGEMIFRGGVTAAGIPACSGCHGPAGIGNPQAAYPVVSGQNATYTALQLRAFRSGERNNDPNAMMQTLAHRLSDVEIDAVANYMGGLFPRERP